MSAFSFLAVPILLRPFDRGDRETTPNHTKHACERGQARITAVRECSMQRFATDAGRGSDLGEHARAQYVA